MAEYKHEVGRAKAVSYTGKKISGGKKKSKKSKKKCK
jgi:hypothetical protein